MPDRFYRLKPWHGPFDFNFHHYYVGQRGSLLPKGWQRLPYLVWKPFSFQMMYDSHLTRVAVFSYCTYKVGLFIVMCSWIKEFTSNALFCLESAKKLSLHISKGRLKKVTSEGMVPVNGGSRELSILIHVLVCYDAIRMCTQPGIPKC